MAATTAVSGAAGQTLCPVLGIVAIKASAQFAVASWAVVIAAPPPQSFVSLYQLRMNSRLSLDAGFMLRVTNRVQSALSALWYKAGIVHGALSLASIYVRVASDDVKSAPPIDSIKETDLELSSAGDVRLCCFGLTGIKVHAASDDSINVCAGFAAPEILLTPYSTASDIYSLGLVLASCLSSQGGPYASQSQLAAMNYRQSTADTALGSSAFAITVPSAVRVLATAMTNSNPLMRASYTHIDSTVSQLLAVAVAEAKAEADAEAARNRKSKPTPAPATAAAPKPAITNSFAVGSAVSSGGDESDPSALAAAAKPKSDSKSDVKGMQPTTTATASASGGGVKTAPAPAPAPADDGSVVFYDFSKPNLSGAVEVRSSNPPTALRAPPALTFNPYDESNIPCTVLARTTSLRFPVPLVPVTKSLVEKLVAGAECGSYTIQIEMKVSSLPLVLFAGTPNVSPAAIATAHRITEHLKALNSPDQPSKSSAGDEDDADDDSDRKGPAPPPPQAQSTATPPPAAAAVVVPAVKPVASSLPPLVTINARGGVQLFGKSEIRASSLLTEGSGWHLMTIVVAAPLVCHVISSPSAVLNCFDCPDLLCGADRIE